MNKLERLCLGLVLGAVFPLIGFLAGWWSTCQVFSNFWILVFALIGLLFGIGIDATFLKGWVARAFEIDMRWWMALYVFYSICVFGFFMGVPVFNLLLAIPAGMFVGRKLAHQRSAAEDGKQLLFRAKIATTGVLAMMCAASAFLALRDPTTAANLEGMLGLQFEVTQAMIISLIVVGGAGLLATNWGLVSFAAKIAQKWEV